MSRQMVSAQLLTLVALTGCGDAVGERLSPPPDGFPALARSYQLTVEVTASQCEPGAMAVLGGVADVAVSQDGVSLSWTQTMEGATSSWLLEGAICPRGEQFEIRLSGGRLARYRYGDQVCSAVAWPEGQGCEGLEQAACVAEVGCVYTDEEGCAAEGGAFPDDPCDDPFAVRLSLGSDGVLSGEVTTYLFFGSDCMHGEACVISQRWDATPLSAWTPAS